MTRGAGSTKNLLVSFDQASEKASDWALWFEVSFGIFLKSLYTAWRTKVVKSALVGANQGVRVSPGDLHPAYRIYDFCLLISFQDSAPYAHSVLCDCSGLINSAL
jgi:hypothetical protein